MSNRPLYLVEPPSITAQTDWPCGFYDLPETNAAVPCVHFNCGIVHWQKRDWLITRTQTSHPRIQSKINFWPLADNVPGVHNQVIVSGCFPDESAEDPRAFVTEDDRLFLSWVAWRYVRPGKFAHQVFGEMSPVFQVRSPQHVVYGKNGNTIHRNKGCEKNWVWFLDEGGFHCVYAMHPHTVCKVMDGVVATVHSTAGDQRIWTYGEQRGGSPPVRVGNDYYCFFHSSLRWHDPYRRYFMGCYAFSAEPPYEMTGITPYPLLFGSLSDPRPRYGGPLVVFACGAIHREGEWLVTLGSNDCRCAWIRIPHGELIGKMVQV